MSKSHQNSVQMQQQNYINNDNNNYNKSVMVNSGINQDVSQLLNKQSIVPKQNQKSGNYISKNSTLNSNLPGVQTHLQPVNRKNNNTNNYSSNTPSVAGKITMEEIQRLKKGLLDLGSPSCGGSIFSQSVISNTSSQRRVIFKGLNGKQMDQQSVSSKHSKQSIFQSIYKQDYAEQENNRAGGVSLQQLKDQYQKQVQSDHYEHTLRQLQKNLRANSQQKLPKLVKGSHHKSDGKQIKSVNVSKKNSGDYDYNDVNRSAVVQKQSLENDDCVIDPEQAAGTQKKLKTALKKPKNQLQNAKNNNIQSNSELATTSENSSPTKTKPKYKTEVNQEEQDFIQSLIQKEQNNINDEQQYINDQIQQQQLENDNNSEVQSEQQQQLDQEQQKKADKRIQFQQEEDDYLEDCQLEKQLARLSQTAIGVLFGNNPPNNLTEQEIMELMAVNKDYFDHKSGKCLCSQCNCGKCKRKCEDLNYKINMPHKVQWVTSYNKDFHDGSVSGNSSINTNSAARAFFLKQQESNTFNVLPSPHSMVSTMRADFKGDHQKKQSAVDFSHHVADSPFYKLSSYKSNFINYGKPEAVNVSRDNELTTHRNMPFLVKQSTSKAAYGQFDPIKTEQVQPERKKGLFQKYPQIVKSGKRKSEAALLTTTKNGQMDNLQSVNKTDFQSPQYKFENHSKQKENFEAIPAFEGQFTSQSKKEYIDKNKPCNAQKLLRQQYLRRLKQIAEHNPDIRDFVQKYEEKQRQKSLKNSNLQMDKKNPLVPKVQINI